MNVGALLAQTARPEPALREVEAEIPPIRPLGHILSVTQDSLLYLGTIRVLSNGRVLANDTKARRVVVFDSSLAHMTTVIDTTGATNRAWGEEGGWLMPFKGDSSIFADFEALSFEVLSPAGKIVRTTAAPLLGGDLGYLQRAFIDPQGRVVTNVTPVVFAKLSNPSASSPGHAQILPNGSLGISGIGSSTTLADLLAGLPKPGDPPAVTHDSTAIVRVSRETRRIDSSVWMMGQTRGTITVASEYGPTPKILRNLLPVSDAWTMLDDGTIAVVREHDYHIDWISPSGAITSSPKVAHEWEALSDSLRQAMVDSVRRGDSTNLAAQRKDLDSANKANGTPKVCHGVYVGTTLAILCAEGPLPIPEYLDPSELPSYYPPFPYFGTAVIADAEGNLWVRVNLPSPPAGGLVYDIVNRLGILVDRVQIPGGTNIAGFGPGVVYLSSREGGGYKLARARIH